MNVVDASFITQLQSILGPSAVLTAHEDLVVYGFDGTAALKARPGAVVLPSSTEQVAACVKLAREASVPVVTRGSGTGLSGGSVPVEGCLVICLVKMSRILELDEANLTLHAECGVITKDIDDAAARCGLFYPPDPGSMKISTIGGNVAENSGGLRGLKYGVTRDYVMGLKVVLPTGEVVWLGNKCVKDVAGYSMKDLFIGSEGTLGIITEVTVRLYPQPEAISAAICNFPDLRSAVQSVIEVIQMGIPIARVEFMDTAAVRATNAYSKLTLKESPLLLFEFHGSPSGVQEQAQVVQEITRENGGMDFEWADKAEDRSRLWTARHNAYFAGLQLRPGCRSSTTDVCVPISALAECVAQTAADMDQAPFPYTIVGHVGDGNFHVLMLLDADSQEEWDESERLNHRLVERAIAMQGTCTGEHGVGLHKMEFMLAEHGQDALDVMSSIKQALDPHNIMNPGKMLPPRPLD